MVSSNEKDLYDLLLGLVAIPSISDSRSGQENRAAEFIYERLSKLEYFKDHPDLLRYLPCEGDFLERKSVCALVRSPAKTRSTVIVTGHFDVVDAEAYGPLKALAFSPEELTRRVGELEMPDDAKRDLASGRYLFGRGVLDMKAGVAAEMAFLGDLSRSLDLPVNVLFLAVPDEENNSTGMRSAVSWLVHLREEWNLDYTVCLNGEPSVGSDGLSVYLGTIGKMLPFYFCVGKATHVGQYYDGVSSSLLVANLSLLLEGAAETSEAFEGQMFPPQVCLRFHDLVRNYSVTLPERAVAYYNQFTVTKTPAQVLEEMKGTATEALRRTVAYLKEQRDVLRSKGGLSVHETPMEPRVMTYEELERLARARTVDFEGALDVFLKALPSSLDQRERGTETVSFLLDRSGEKGPMIIVGFLPPYCPPRVNTRRSAEERNILDAVAKLQDDVEREGLSLTEVEVFQGIMDLSFMGFQGDLSDLDALAANMPLWGRGYDIPLVELAQIDIPIVNFGPMGKGEHKNSERIDLPFYLRTFPRLFRRFVEHLAGSVAR